MTGKDGAVSNLKNNKPGLRMAPDVGFRELEANRQVNNKRPRDKDDADNPQNSNGGDEDKHNGNDNDDNDNSKRIQASSSSADRKPTPRPKRNRSPSSWPPSDNLVHSPRRTPVKNQQAKTRHRRDRQVKIAEDLRFGITGTAVGHLPELGGTVQSARESRVRRVVANSHPASGEVAGSASSAGRESQSQTTVVDTESTSAEVFSGPISAEGESQSPHEAAQDHGDTRNRNSGDENDNINSQGGNSSVDDSTTVQPITKVPMPTVQIPTVPITNPPWPWGHGLRLCRHPEHNDRFAEIIWLLSPTWDGNPQGRQLPPRCPWCYNDTVIVYSLVDYSIPGTKRRRTSSPRRVGKRVCVLSPSTSPTSDTNPVLEKLGILHLFDPSQPLASVYNSHSDEFDPRLLKPHRAPRSSQLPVSMSL